MTLAINPLSSISTDPISVPRAAAARRAPSMLRIPDAIRAAYSPKEWPATISGWCPYAFRACSMAKSAVNIAGCVYSVCLSLCSAAIRSSFSSPSLRTNDDNVSPSSTSTIVESEACQTFCTGPYRWKRSVVIPTYCEP